MARKSAYRSRAHVFPVALRFLTPLNAVELRFLVPLSCTSYRVDVLYALALPWLPAAGKPFLVFFRAACTAKRCCSGCAALYTAVWCPAHNVRLLHAIAVTWLPKDGTIPLCCCMARAVMCA